MTKQQLDPQADNMSCSPVVVPLFTTRFLFLGGGFHGASRGCKGVHGPQGHWVSGVSWGVGISGGIGCGSSVDGVRAPTWGVGALGLLGDVGVSQGVGAVRGHWGLAGGVGVSGVYWGLARSAGT